MYGKTLADFPGRLNEFLEEFSDTSADVLDSAFRIARGRCREFPTPADVRSCIAEVKPDEQRIQAAYERRKEAILLQPEQKQLKSVLDVLTPTRPLRMLTEEEYRERMDKLKKQFDEVKDQNVQADAERRDPDSGRSQEGPDAG